MLSSSQQYFCVYFLAYKATPSLLSCICSLRQYVSIAARKRFLQPPKSVYKIKIQGKLG